MADFRDNSFGFKRIEQINTGEQIKHRGMYVDDALKVSNKKRHWEIQFSRPLRTVVAAGCGFNTM